MNTNEYNYTKKILKNIPDIREEKVIEFKDKIKKDYKVNIDNFAEKILEKKGKK